MNRTLLGKADVRLIVGAVGVSALGDFLLWVPLTLHLQAMTDSGIAVAALMICLWMPIVLLAPVAGLLVDRIEARGVLIVASLAQAVIAGVLALALDSVAAILVLAALLGVGFAIAQPAEFALVPVIGAEEDLSQLNGYIESARYFGILAGPPLGGFLAGAGGTDVAIAVNGVTFLGVALAAWTLKARRPPASVLEGVSDRARDGVVYLFRDRTLRLALGVVFVSLLFMSASITAEVFFLKEDLEVSDAVYGLLFSSWGAGMVIGALLLARRVAHAALVTGVLAATAIQGFGLGAPTALLAVGFAASMWFVGGLGHGIKNVLARTLIQERVPSRLHGRAFAAYNGLRNGAELFALAGGGLLVAALGGRATLALAGGVSMLAGLIGLAIHLSRRRREPTTDEVAMPGADATPALLGD
jgi:MFS family permease